MAYLILGMTIGFLVGVPCGGEFIKALQRRKPDYPAPTVNGMEE